MRNNSSCPSPWLSIFSRAHKTKSFSFSINLYVLKLRAIYTFSSSSEEASICRHLQIWNLQLSFPGPFWRCGISPPLPHRPFLEALPSRPGVTLVVSDFFHSCVKSVWISQCLTESIRGKKSYCFLLPPPKDRWRHFGKEEKIVEVIFKNRAHAVKKAVGIQS